MEWTLLLSLLSFGLFGLMNVQLPTEDTAPAPADPASPSEASPSGADPSEPPETPKVGYAQQQEAYNDIMGEIDALAREAEARPDAPTTAEGEPGEEHPEEPRTTEPTSTENTEKSDYFYDPEIHAKGETDLYPNKYKTRENAEEAMLAKVDLIQKRIEKLKELGSGEGAIPVPDLLKDKLAQLNEVADIERFIEMDDTQLRTAAKELDQFAHRLDQKSTRLSEARSQQEAQQSHHRELQELNQGVSTFFEELGVTDKINPNMYISEVRATLEQEVTQKVESALKNEQKALDDFVKKQEQSGSLSYTDFITEYKSREQALQEKKQTLTEHYQTGLKQFDTLVEKTQQPQGEEAQQQNEAQRQEHVKNNYDEFKEDIKTHIPFFNQQGSEQEKAFLRWALHPKHDGKFNLEQSPAQWLVAYKAYTQQLSELRSKRSKPAPPQQKPLPRGESYEQFREPRYNTNDDLFSEVTALTNQKIGV